MNAEGSASSTPEHSAGPPVALVIGGSRGIGRAVAEQLAELGYVVVVTARGVWQPRDRGGRAGMGRCQPVVADACDEHAMRRLFDDLALEHGRLDVLVNNVGGISHAGPFEALTDADWMDTYSLNVMTAVRTINLALPLLRVRGGSVISISSFVAASPGEWNPHYSTAKAALVHLTRHLARRYAAIGIRFNVVSPGHVDTQGWRVGLRDRSLASHVAEDELVSAEVSRIKQLVPMGRLARPDEIASVVAFLAGDQSSYVTGIDLRVDGGRTA